MSERLSLLVSHILDNLGYSEEMRQYRINKYSDQNFVNSLCSEHTTFHKVLAGSKAEGASKYDESDYDILHVLNSAKAIKCTDEVEGDEVLTLYMEDETAPPGYCKLRLLQCVEDNMWHLVFSHAHCFVKCPGYDRPYLSSTFVLTSLHEIIQSHFPGQMRGPAHKMQLDGFKDIDSVFAIRCDHTPHVLKQWLRRRKRYEWPQRVTEQIVHSDVFLVPVGKHGSHYQYLEWRISFNEAEKILINNFTTVQYQVYILVKKIMKEVIQPQCPESITSYIIKTLMLWVVESIPGESWRKDKLIGAVLYVLEMLHTCVQQNVCPMYFIPEDNILEGRLKEETRRDVFHIISTLLKYGVACVLQVPNLASQIYNFMERGVHAPIHDVLVGQQREKAHILLHNIRILHVTTLKINNRKDLLCCQDESTRIPYKDILADIVMELPSPHTRCLVEHILNQTLSHFSLQKCADSVDSASNIQKYPSIRQSLTILHQKHRNDVLCGRLRLAQVLYFLGQYREAQNVLVKYVKRDYFLQIATRTIINKTACNLRLQYVLGNECLSTTDFLKYFILYEIMFDKQMEACLPSALKYKLYIPDALTGIAKVDPEPLLYYLQYICFTKLGQTGKSESAIAYLKRCATRIDCNIEYREVALNVLAHCMFKKGLYDFAAKLLIRSVMLYKQYQCAVHAEELKRNTAVWHIAILLYKIRNNR